MGCLRLLVLNICLALYSTVRHIDTGSVCSANVRTVILTLYIEVYLAAAGIHGVYMSLLKQPVCSYSAYPSYILLAILCRECYNVEVRLHIMFLFGKVASLLCSSFQKYNF